LGYHVQNDLHRITFSSDAGLEGWQVFGGSDLITFNNNHTAQTEITEISPGRYQADVSLPDWIEQHYFLRVVSVNGEEGTSTGWRIGALSFQNVFFCVRGTFCLADAVEGIISPAFRR